MKQYAASKLVEDFDFYPRIDVDDQHVGNLAMAITAGAVLPPVVIEKRSKRIIDGFHRRRALVKVHGQDAMIDVEEKVYDNDAAMLLDAITLNASHGKRLATGDYARILIKASAFGINDIAVSQALHITTQKLEDIRTTRIAKVSPKAASYEEHTLGSVALKSTIKHMAGHKLTEKQVKANERIGGMKQSFYVGQVILLIENDLLDIEDTALIEKLAKLRELLDVCLESASVAKIAEESRA